MRRSDAPAFFHTMHMTDLASQASLLLQQQKASWPLARDNFDALARVRTRAIQLDDFTMRLQFNAARIVSSGAQIDPKSIVQRKCFLCGENRPAEQASAAVGSDYLLLVNPFPIFREHFTIPRTAHVLQR